MSSCLTAHQHKIGYLVSSESRCAVRQFRHSQNAWARHVERVHLCRVEPSGIWARGGTQQGRRRPTDDSADEDGEIGRHGELEHSGILSVFALSVRLFRFQVTRCMDMYIFCSVGFLAHIIVNAV